MNKELVAILAECVEMGAVAKAVYFERLTELEAMEAGAADGRDRAAVEKQRDNADVVARRWRAMFISALRAAAIYEPQLTDYISTAFWSAALRVYKYGMKDGAEQAVQKAYEEWRPQL